METTAIMNGWGGVSHYSPGKRRGMLEEKLHRGLYPNELKRLGIKPPPRQWHPPHRR